MGMPATARRLAADASLLGVAVMWGATFSLGKEVLRFLPPFQYLGLRFALASLLLLPLAWGDLRHFQGRAACQGLVTGSVLFCAYTLQTLGLRMTTASEAGLITGLNVIIVPLLTTIWYRRPPDALTAAGIATAAGGLWLLAWHGMSVGAGDLLVLGCAVAIAVHILLVGRFAGTLPPAAFATLQIGAVAVLAGAMGWFTERRPTLVPPEVAGAVAVMAVGGTLLAYLAQTWAQRFTSPVRVGLLFSVEPVAAVAFGILLLGESLSLPQALGAAAILAGVAMGEVGR